MELEKLNKTITKLEIFQNITGFISIIGILGIGISIITMIWDDFIQGFKVLGTSLIIYSVGWIFNKAVSIVLTELKNKKNDSIN
jgi:hypothetical protein